MYFIVGKTINQNKQIVSYLITDGNDVQEVAPQQVYIEYQKGNLTYLKGFNTTTGEVDFQNINNSLITTFYNGRGISNSVSVLKILEENNKQIGVRILVASGKIKNVRLLDIIKLVNDKRIQLFNAKVVNNKIVMKYAGTAVTETSRGNEEVTINNYDKSKFIIDDNLRLIKYTSNDKKVIVPKGVTSIGNEAFFAYTGLESIVIPNSVTSIGDNAFNSCTGLTEIVIPDSVISIGEGAFAQCTGLTDVVIPNSVTNIGSRAFANCNGLTNITIPDSVTCINYCTFQYCTSLTNIIIPDSVKSIDRYAFEYCESLTSITIPYSVTGIGDGAFYGCPNICIKVVRGSTAKGYAQDNNIKFEVIT